MNSRINPFAYLAAGSLPNWRDAQAYPDPSVASLNTWATEFMARNPAFQRDARELFARVEAMAPAAQNPPAEPSIYGMPVPVHDFWVALDAGISELLGKYGVSRYPYFEVMRIPARTYADLFGHGYDLINRLYGELASLRGEPAPTLPFNPLPAPRDDREREYWIALKEHAQFAVRFNLEYPLKPQLAAAQKLLQAERARLAEQGRIEPITNRRQLKRARLYRTYLQVLDAEAAGASIREVAEALFSRRRNEYADRAGDQAARDALATARKLRDGGYRNLPLLQK